MRVTFQRHVCAGDFRARSLPCSFRSTIPERKERLLGLLFPPRTSPTKTRKAPGALDPAVVLPPLGV